MRIRKVHYTTLYNTLLSVNPAHNQPPLTRILTCTGALATQKSSSAPSPGLISSSEPATAQSLVFLLSEDTTSAS